MTLPTLAILLFVAAFVLIVAELLLPAHGIIGGLGAAALVAGVAVSFYLNQWLGLGLAAGFTVATPFAVAAWMKLWPKTPVGRRMFLAPPPPTVPAAPVRLGQAGVTVSELRPMGVCDFAGQRLPARSELGMIPPGHSVRVIAVQDGHAVVRAV